MPAPRADEPYLFLRDSRFPSRSPSSSLSLCPRCVIYLVCLARSDIFRQTRSVSCPLVLPPSGRDRLRRCRRRRYSSYQRSRSRSLALRSGPAASNRVIRRVIRANLNANLWLKRGKKLGCCYENPGRILFLLGEFWRENCEPARV